jgi:bifunctional DNA primase/polymerase-like protein
MLARSRSPRLSARPTANAAAPAPLLGPVSADAWRSCRPRPSSQIQQRRPPVSKPAFIVQSASLRARREREAGIGPLKTRSLRLAIAAAIAAYALSGKMLDAVLVYAAHGFPIFPLTIDKTPVPQRDRDVHGKPIPGTGSFKKATINPLQIRAWWTDHEYLIGLPTGAASGAWCLDIDTSEDHADGVKQWEAIAAQHDPIVTREHRSATGGPHLFFNWSPILPIRCGSGTLPDGISVKGEGGYVVVPPSQRKGRSYRVARDIDASDAPQWLLESCKAARGLTNPSAGRSRPSARRSPTG